MERLGIPQVPCRANRLPGNVIRSGGPRKSLWILLFASLMLLAACGSNTSSTPIVVVPLTLTGNWQFTAANPADKSFTGGLQGGFLQEDSNGSVTGQVAFSIYSPSYLGGATPCNSGSATITGTIKDQDVTLTGQAGMPTSGGITFTFSGRLSLDSTTLVGTYTSTAGTAPDGSSCGTAQNGLQWNATFVPPLTGFFQGSFHSTGGARGLQDQNFPVRANLVQGENIGTSNATVTGTLDFRDPVTFLNNYPCLSTATVTGQISGSSVVLQIFATNGLNVGQIGEVTPGQFVNYASTQGGYLLRNPAGNAYAVNSGSCPGASLSNAGDTGNICLALTTPTAITGTACTQPITLSPASLIFPLQTLDPGLVLPPPVLGSGATTQTITLTNTDPSGGTLSGLQLQWSVIGGAFDTPSDFNGLPNFSEADTCATPLGSTFTLSPRQSCTITIAFAPQQSCPWLPLAINNFGQLGAPPAQCPVPLTAKLTVISPRSADHDNSFVVPIKGVGLSAIQPSVRELDFGSESVGEASLPQMLTFTNQTGLPIQILPHAAVSCGNTDQVTLPHPLQNDGTVDGVRVARTDSFASIFALPPTIAYFCDSDPQSGEPNFQISSDTCSGVLLPPQNTCSLQITFVPQPGTNLAGAQGNGLDYFLQLNTLQCSSSSNVAANCEIDSGRFPVELRTNPPSPLRMSPGAGLDFGYVGANRSSSPQTITLLNDPNDPNAAIVNFSGKVVKGDYTETDDCGSSLAQGSSCTITVTFKPKVVGFDPGTITISYNNGQIQTIYLRGTGQ